MQSERLQRFHFWVFQYLFHPTARITDAKTKKRNVALVLRGVCTFVEKVQLAEQLNAAGVIVFNDGASSDRMGVMSPGLPDGVKIPALFGSYRTGIRLQAFLEVGAVSLSISSSSTVELVTFSNTITETEGGNANSIIMVGAHLDSVPAGPGKPTIPNYSRFADVP